MSYELWGMPLVHVSLVGVALAALLYFIAPDFFRPMFTNALGLLLIGFSLVSIAVGNVLIRRLARVEV